MAIRAVCIQSEQQCRVPCLVSLVLGPERVKIVEPDPPVAVFIGVTNHLADLAVCDVCLAQLLQNVPAHYILVSRIGPE